jgi:hypothetical protein
MQSEEVNRKTAISSAKSSLRSESAGKWRRWLAATRGKAAEVRVEIGRKQSERPGQ